ncbi:MAG: DUF5668 domain-containing protein [bacterium]
MKRTWVGILLIVVGLMFLLDSFGVITFHNLIHHYWPVLLILTGVYILLKGRK